jgi:hypothetical protein
MNRSQLAREAIEKFPNLSKHKLAELLLKQHPFLFKDKEQARYVVKSVTNNYGREGQKVYQTDKYQGVLPQGEKNDFSPFVLKGKRIGILSDIHIPYHDLDALGIALNEFKRVKIDTLVLNGDVIDAYNLSSWQKDPNMRDHSHEIKLLTIFLDDLIKMFPKVELIMKLANHEERYERFISAKTPEFIGFHVLSWKHLINLRFDSCKKCEGTGLINARECPDCERGLLATNVSRGIHLVRNKRIIKAGKLNIVHAHEFNGGSSPVNAARAFYNKAKTNVIGGHLHQVSEHSEPDMDGKVTGAWSTGCLCDLHPNYAPINRWQHGFAWVEVDNDGDFEVHNQKIINGKIK